MRQADQAARQAWLTSATPARMTNITELDRKYIARMKEILASVSPAEVDEELRYLRHVMAQR